MTNTNDLKKEIKLLQEKVKELESIIEQYQEPINIEKVFEVLPVHDSVQIITKIQANLYGKIRERQEQIKNEGISLENNMELMKIYSKHIVEDKLFSKNFK